MESGPYWTDVVVAITAIVGTVAGLAAVAFTGFQLRESRLAARQTERDALHSRDIAERARKASIRPALQVRKVALLPGGTERFLEVTIRNDGAGVAVMVTAFAWFVEIPEGIFSARATAFDPWRIGLETQGAMNNPKLRIAFQSIAPQAEASGYFMVGTDVLHATGDRALVYMTIEFQDLDGTTFHYPEESGAQKIAFVWRVAQLENRLPTLN